MADMFHEPYPLPDYLAEIQLTDQTERCVGQDGVIAIKVPNKFNGIENAPYAIYRYDGVVEIIPVDHIIKFVYSHTMPIEGYPVWALVQIGYGERVTNTGFSPELKTFLYMDKARLILCVIDPEDGEMNYTPFGINDLMEMFQKHPEGWMLYKD